MKKLFLLIISAFCIVGMYAQNDGGITPEMLTKIKAGYQNTPENKALRNAIVANDINKLAANADNSTAFDDHFSNKVNSKAITDQKSSGRCWMFTGMNVMRSKAIAKHNLPADFQFSQAYTFFWDQLEKSNLFLQAVLDHRAKSMEDKYVEWLFKNPIGDGGQFTGVADLVTKYGIVPKDVMPETYSSNSTSRMSNILSLKLREYGLELRKMANNKSTTEQQLQDRKTEMLQTIYRILVMTIGEPPTEFTWTQDRKSVV